MREYHSFHESAAAVGAAVIVGGQALGPELRSRLVFAGLGDRMAHLAEFARRLSPSEESPETGRIGNVSPSRIDPVRVASPPGVLWRKGTR